MRRLALLLIVLSSAVAFAQHSASLSWIQSTSTDVTGNNVYRSTVAGGPYQIVDQSTSPVTNFIDTNVVGLATYYYVVTATCSSCSPSESAFSNEVKAVIPGDPRPASPGTLTVTTK